MLIGVNMSGAINTALNGISIEQEQDICKDYHDGMKMVDIATKYFCDINMNKYNVAHRVVLPILKRNAIILHKDVYSNLSEEKKLDILRRFQDGEAMNFICETEFPWYEPNSGVRCIIRPILSEFGIKSKQGNFQSQLIYEINEKFFDTWSVQSSYVLGWIITDAHVYPNPHARVVFDLKDREPLEKFRRYMGSTHPISEIHTIHKITGNSTKFYRYKFGSKYMINRLVDLGVVGNKTSIIKPPYLPDTYLPDLFRGMIDGDGSISISESGNNRSLIFCTSSKNMLSWVENLLNERNINFHVYPQQKIKSIVYNIQISKSSELYKILTWLYHKDIGDSYLTRKYLHAQRILSIIRERYGI